MKNPLIIPFFIPHAGCPFTCVFCNQWQISGAVGVVRPEEIDLFVGEYLKKARLWPGRRVEIAFYGGSFTALPVEIQSAYLQAAAAQKRKGFIHGIRLSTRPDFINAEIVQRLFDDGVTTVELGVQSLVDEVLRQTGRGHWAEDSSSALRVLRGYALKIGYQLMIGLPGDTPDYARLTLQKATQDRPDFVRIYPALVLKGTTLANWYLEKKYRPWGLDETVEMAATWLGTFSFYRIPVIRLGLQANENLMPEGDLLAGPYHPAFGELVASRLFLRQMEQGIAKAGRENRYNKNDGLNILAHPLALSKVIGQKKGNLQYLREKYGTVDVLAVRQNILAEEDVLIKTPLQSILVKREEFLKEYRIEDIDNGCTTV